LLDLPLLDEALFEVSTALLSSQNVAAVLDALSDMLSDSKSASSAHLIERLLPTVHGICRALQLHPHAWSDADLEKIASLAMTFEFPVTLKHGSTSRDGYYAECILAKYAEYGYTLAPTTIRDILLTTASAMWERALFSLPLKDFISTSQERRVTVLGPSKGLEKVGRDALALHDQLYSTRLAVTSSLSTHQYTDCAAIKTLKLAFLGSMTAPGYGIDEKVVGHLMRAVSESDDLRKDALMLLIAAVKM
jgi:hypothetical protein